MKEQVTDFVSAIIEDSTTNILESDSFKAIMLESASRIISGPAAPIVGSILGAVAPRINGVILSYKQNRLERNIKTLIKTLVARVDSLEKNYNLLSDKMKNQFNESYVEMLLDNIVDERQEEKVAWNVIGFVNHMTNESNENMMQFFFDTMAELTALDIDTLRIYSTESEINWKDLEIKYGIDSYRLRVIKEKLVRLGMLSRKNDQLRDANLDEIVEYLKKTEADSKKRKPHGVRLPKKIKKIRNVETYQITPLGNDFLRGIS